MMSIDKDEETMKEYEKAKLSGDFKEIKTSDTFVELIKEMKKNNNQTVKELIEKNKEICNEEDGSGRTPLHFSVILNNVEITKILIENGSNLNHLDLDGFTPIILGAKHKAYDTVKELIKKGADVNLSSHKKITALHQAADNNDFEMLQILIDGGGNLKQEWSHYGGPIHWACIAGHKKMIEKLISLGSSIDELDGNGGTMLHMCAATGLKEMAECLISKGISIDIQTKTDKTTALHLASEFDHLEIVNLLLKNGANFLKDGDGKGPSGVAKGKVKNMFDSKSLDLKDQGNELFTKSKFPEALQMYLKGLLYNEDSYILYTNW